jgi:hypothetical protein
MISLLKYYVCSNVTPALKLEINPKFFAFTMRIEGFCDLSFASKHQFRLFFVMEVQGFL